VQVKNPVRYRTRVQSLLYRAITLTGPVQLCLLQAELAKGKVCNAFKEL
jgi:hypothetical protein